MNLPNRLSILRIAMIPLCVGLMYVGTPLTDWIALGVFLLACFTDFLDGHIARARGIVTDFGRFIDPVADKLLVLSVMIMLVERGSLPAWLVIAVLARELSVDGLRMVAAGKGHVIAAGPLGKIKTTVQMVTIAAALIDARPFPQAPFTLVLAVLALGFTLWSGIDYFVKNWSTIFTRKEPMA